jgi:hypothetical protein
VSGRIVSVLVAAALLVGCGGTPDAEQIHWRVSLKSSGGVAGNGTGNVVASSDGVVAVERLSRTCRAKLTAENLRGLQRAVAAVAPGRWQTGYAPGEQQMGARLYWRLDVELQGTDGTVRHAHADWHDAAFNQLPDDLAGLAMLARRLLERTEEGCEART